MAEGDYRKFDSRGTSEMAKTSPVEYFRQVKAEAAKVVWPTWPETSRTAIFVAIMMVILAMFFLGIDSIFGTAVRWLLDQV